MILKTFVIRFTLKDLGCELSSSFDIRSDCEEGDAFLLQLAILFKTKRRMSGKENTGTRNFLKTRRRRRSNLTRIETSRLLINIFRNYDILNICSDKITGFY